MKNNSKSKKRLDNYRKIIRTRKNNKVGKRRTMKGGSEAGTLVAGPLAQLSHRSGPLPASGQPGLSPKEMAEAIKTLGNPTTKAHPLPASREFEFMKTEAKKAQDAVNEAQAAAQIALAEEAEYNSIVGQMPRDKSPILTPIPNGVLNRIEDEAEKGIFLVNEELDKPGRFKFAVSCFRNFKEYGCPYTTIKFDGNDEGIVGNIGDNNDSGKNFNLLINKISNYADCFDTVETLDLSQTTITKLPMNFSKMISLKYVYLPKTITSHSFYDFAVKAPALRIIDVPEFYKRKNFKIRRTRINNNASVTTHPRGQDVGTKIAGLGNLNDSTGDTEGYPPADPQAEAEAEAEAAEATDTAEAERLAAAEAAAAEAAKATNLNRIGKAQDTTYKKKLGSFASRRFGKMVETDYLERIKIMEEYLTNSNLRKFLHEVKKFEEKFPHFGKGLLKEVNEILKDDKNITPKNKPKLFKIISNFKLQVQMAQFEQEMKSEETTGDKTELIAYEGIPSMLFELREPVEEEKDDKVKEIIKTIFVNGMDVLEKLKAQREAQQKLIFKNNNTYINNMPILEDKPIELELKEDYNHLLLFPNCANFSLLINLSDKTIKNSSESTSFGETDV